MYTYVTSYVLGHSPGSQWIEKDLSELPLYAVFNNYSDIYLVLNVPYQENAIYAHLGSMRSRLSAVQSTLVNWLIDIGNMTLPLVSEIPVYNVVRATYGDAFQTGYKMDKPKRGVNVPSYFPVSDTSTSVLTRPNYETDMTLIDDYCLVTINGFVHRTASSNDVSYVYNGLDSLSKGKDNHVGILSFLNVGKLTKVQIPLANIYGQHDGSSLNTRCYFNLNNILLNNVSTTIDTTGKSVILVLGGYLVFPQDNVFWRTGPSTFCINFTLLPLVDRYYESHKYINLSSLGVEVNGISPDVINVGKLFSDASIKSYLTLSQSFLVIVDTPNLETTRHYIRRGGPGMFTAYDNPVYPLIIGFGRMAEYWKVREDGQYSINVKDSYIRNKTFNLTPGDNLNNVNGNNIPTNTVEKSRGFFLEISSYTS